MLTGTKMARTTRIYLGPTLVSGIPGSRVYWGPVGRVYLGPSACGSRVFAKLRPRHVTDGLPPPNRPTPFGSRSPIERGVGAAASEMACDEFRKAKAHGRKTETKVTGLTGRARVKSFTSFLSA